MTVSNQLSFTLALLGLVAGCGGKGGGGGPPPDMAVEVVIEKPALQPVEDILGAVGSVEANERVEIKPQVAGLIETIHFSEGQRVAKGDKLFTLDAHKETAAFEQAKAEEQLATANLERANKLVGTKAISQQDLDQLRSQLEVATAARKVGEERLADRTIVAPLDGMLGPRPVSPGQYVIAGALLGTLVDASRVKVTFRIPERELTRVQLGQKGRLRVAPYPERPFEGQVDLINPEVDEATRTIAIRLIAPNPEGLLKPGMFSRVELIVATRQNAVVVPESALVPSLEQFTVFSVENGVARSRSIKLGMRLPGKVEVREGLSAQDQIVTSGTQKLVEGMKVVAAKSVPGEGTPTNGQTRTADAGGVATR
jgi:membrane fusion protein (multidrug efflux system)